MARFDAATRTLVLVVAALAAPAALVVGGCARPVQRYAFINQTDREVVAVVARAELQGLKRQWGTTGYIERVIPRRGSWIMDTSEPVAETGNFGSGYLFLVGFADQPPSEWWAPSVAAQPPLTVEILPTSPGSARPNGPDVVVRDVNGLEPLSPGWDARDRLESRIRASIQERQARGDGPTSRQSASSLAR
jgi:hypothetical protein